MCGRQELLPTEALYWKIDEVFMLREEVCGLKWLCESLPFKQSWSSMEAYIYQ